MKKIKIKKIKPMYTMVLLTCDKYDETSIMFTGTQIIDGKKATKKGGDIDNIQKVIEVGAGCHNVKAGDIVSINLGNFAVKKYVDGEIRDNVQGMTNEIVEYRIPVVEVDGKNCMLIDERDIGYVVTDYEEV